MMGLELYMIGVIVKDMARALEFYRRLGVDVPADSDDKPHVEVRMSGLTFFLSTKRHNARWDPARAEITGTGYRMILEFYLKDRALVDAKYAEMIGYGYASHTAPFEVSPTLYFAMINDPDGNTILLSAFLGEDA
ncbi:MAG: glyoxalase [Chloroflexi bacterium]|nr:glyoxalase [Chloroflexota bacterium]